MMVLSGAQDVSQIAVHTNEKTHKKTNEKTIMINQELLFSTFIF